MAANNNDNISFGYPVYPIIKFKSDNFNDPDGTYLSEAIDYISNYIKVESDNVTKAYLIGMTDTLDNGGRTIYDSGIYITPETGEMAAKKNNYFNGEKSYGYSGIKTIGTTSTQGVSKMVLGNNLATGTNNNARGEILLYGDNTGYTDIKPGANGTSNITLTLPSSTGTIALKSDITSGSHNHDDKYYTESEVNNLLKEKADSSHSHSYASSSHTHDDRYFTESEVNNLLNGKANSSHSHSYASTTHNHELKNLNGITISQSAPSSPSDGHIWISW